MRWWSGLAVLVALIVAVIVVRPSSQELEASLAGPVPEPTSTEQTDVEAPVQGPDDLRSELMIADVAISPLAIGPLRLGLQQADLAEAGWTFGYRAGDCVRVVPAYVGEVAFSGWVVDDRLVSAQVEMTSLLGRTSPTELGFTFGRPLEEAEGFEQQLVVAGAGGVDGDVAVGVGTRSLEGAEVLVSDLGRYGVRYAEVRRTGAPDCEVTEVDLGETELPAARVVSWAFIDSLGAGEVGPMIEVVGVSAEQLQAAPSPWATASAGLSSTGCERIQEVTTTGATELFLQDGVVVGQRYVATGSVETEQSGSGIWSVDEAGALVQRSRVEYGRGGGGAGGTTEAQMVMGVFSYAAEVVADLDTAVVIEEPLVLEESSGEICSSP